MFYVHAVLTHMSKSSKFSGLSIPSQQYKVSAYADDLVMFCSDRQDDKNIFSFFDATSSIFNTRKMNLLHIGPKPFSTTYRKEDVEICGIRFNFKNDRFLIFRDCESKMEKRIEKYKHLPQGKDNLIQ